MKIAPLAEVKDRLSAYVDAARESAIVVTRNGKPVALLTPILDDDDLDALLLAHDRSFNRLLAEARGRVHSGRYLTTDRFWREVRRRKGQDARPQSRRRSSRTTTRTAAKSMK